MNADEGTLPLNYIDFNHIGTWIPQRGIKYYWWSIESQKWWVVSGIDHYGLCIFIRDSQFKTTVILPDVSWFRPLKVVSDIAATYIDGWLLHPDIVE